MTYVVEALIVLRIALLVGLLLYLLHVLLTT